MNENPAHWHKTILGISIVLVFSVGVLAGYLFTTKKIVSLQLDRLSRTEKAENEERKQFDTKSIFYYRQEYRPDIFSIGKFNLGSSDKDALAIQASGRYQILGPSNKQGEYLVKKVNTIYVINQVKNKFSELLDIPSVDGSLMHAAVSRDGKILAYTTNTEPEKSRDYKAELWLYSLENKSKQKIFESTLGLFAGLSVLGWSNNGEQIILREMGGDAGAVWGQLFVINTKPPYESMVLSKNSELLSGQLSRNGDLLLYKECDKPSGVHPIEERVECDEGEQIKTYNILTKETQSLYRNLTHSDNVLKGKLRVIFDILWAENDIIFSIPDGIFRLDLPEKTITELYKFDWVDPDEIFNQPTYLDFMSGGYLVFERWNHYGGRFIFDLISNRVIEFTDWAEGFLD